MQPSSPAPKQNESRRQTSPDSQAAHTKQLGRLAVLGEAAAGAAHEINNHVNGVINYGQILCDQLHDAGQDDSFSRNILHEGERIASIVHALLAFSRGDEDADSLFDLREPLDAALSMARKTIEKHGVRTYVQAQPNMPLCRGSLRDMQQAFLHLLFWALRFVDRQSAHPDSPSTITATLHATPNAGADGKNHVTLTLVADCGLKPHEKDWTAWNAQPSPANAVELGLAASDAIVREHGGSLQFERRPGNCVCAAIQLPAWQSGE